MAALMPCLDCGALSDKNRCPQHRRVKERLRNRRRAPKRVGRYGAAHQQLRKAWEPRVLAGEVHCRRGEGCLRYPDTKVRAGDKWHLGHPDALCEAPTAPEHKRCNEHYAGVLS
jgi:hypothetical protein